MTRRLALIAGVLVALACDGGRQQLPSSILAHRTELATWPTDAELPTEWDVTKMLPALDASSYLGRQTEVLEAEVIAWMNVSGGHIELRSAIAWVHAARSGEKVWALTRFAQRGQSPWRVYEIDDAPQFGFRPYSAAPTLFEVYEFFNDCWWSFDIYGNPVDLAGSHITSSGIQAASWTRCVGALPSADGAAR